MAKGRGWHGDSVGHAKAGRKGGLASAAARRRRKEQKSRNKNN